MLGGFELESLDHLQARLDDSSLDQAKKRIADAVRELQFCVATGLRRMRKVVDKNRVTFLQHLPGKDHMSIWVEESTGNWLALDEPYHSPYIDNLYYGKERAKYQGFDELRQGVREARTLILAGYNECRPRRDILKVLDAVEKNAIAQAINA